MAEGMNPAAGEHLPHFITPPGEVDQLFVIMAVSVVLAIVGMGVLYFRLHALPEQMAHKAESTQLQLIGVLAILALFTHNNLFWVAALVLAAVKLPDISGPLGAIASALSSMSGRRAEGAEAQVPAEPAPVPPAAERSAEPRP
ncbi:MAG: hypothetical protein AAFQ88_08740, partial [Pseudomonadota bacterium]